jgi:hypothetical protein
MMNEVNYKREPWQWSIAMQQLPQTAAIKTVVLATLFLMNTSRLKQGCDREPKV